MIAAAAATIRVRPPAASQLRKRWRADDVR
jgi:hypothetical protein